MNLETLWEHMGGSIWLAPLEEKCQLREVDRMDRQGPVSVFEDGTSTRCKGVSSDFLLQITIVRIESDIWEIYFETSIWGLRRMIMLAPKRNRMIQI